MSVGDLTNCEKKQSVFLEDIQRNRRILLRGFFGIISKFRRSSKISCGSRINH
jgi:hypothetical protein